MVTPGNNYFFKRLIEFQVISFLLSRTKGQLQSLREILQAMSNEHLLIVRRFSLKEIRSSIEMIPFSRAVSLKNSAEFEHFFSKIAELKDALKSAKITDQTKNTTRDLWDLMDDEKVQKGLSIRTTELGNLKRKREPHRRNNSRCRREFMSK